MLFSVPIMTGVSPDRQKVMIAGVTLTDQDWGRAKAKIKNVRNSFHGKYGI